MATMKLVRNDLERFKKQIARAPQHFDAWAARTLPRLYGNAQRMRWASDGSTEGRTWDPPMSPGYVKWKTRYFAGWAGGGTKTQLASSRLMAGMLPPGERQGIFLGAFPERVLTPSGRVVHDSTYWRSLRSGWGREFRAIQGGGKVQYLTAVPYAREASERNEIFRFEKATRAGFRRSFRAYLKRAALRKGAS